MTKIKLLVPKVYKGSVYPAESVMLVSPEQAEAWVNAKDAVYVTEPLPEKKLKEPK